MPSLRTLGVVDALALVVFVAVGSANHEAGRTAADLAATLVPFVGSWFAVAALTRLYVRGGVGRLVVTWVVAVPVAAVVRSVVRGGPWDERLPVFAGVALAFTAVFLLVGRLGAGAWERARRQEPSPSGRRDASSDVTS